MSSRASRGSTSRRTPDEPAGLPPADQERAAREIVLRQLDAMARTRAQLAEKLAGRGISDEVAERVLDRMAEIGLVDDAAYAAAFVRTRYEGRGLARRALAQELRRRGVSREDAAPALDGLDGDAERVRARDLVSAKLPATRGLDRDRRVRRLVSMLARRGYAPGLAFDVVREAMAVEGEDLDGVIPPE